MNTTNYLPLQLDKLISLLHGSRLDYIVDISYYFDDLYLYQIVDPVGCTLSNLKVHYLRTCGAIKCSVNKYC